MIGRRTFWGVGLVFLGIVFGLHPTGWAEQRYTVKPGDTLAAISKSVGVTPESLKAANGLKSDRLKPKQSLIIPGDKKTRRVEASQSAVKQGAQKSKAPMVAQRSYVIQKGDTLQAISKKTGHSVEEIRRINQLGSSPLKVGRTLSLETLPVEQSEEEVVEADDAEEDAAADTEQEVQGDSEPIGKWSTPEERSLLIRVVKTFLGAPYRLGGSTLKGLDCSAFVKRIYEVFNVQLPRTAREQSNVGRAVGKHELQEGDLVFFKAQAPRTSNAHVGIYIGNNQFVHASSRNREVKVDSLSAPYFSSHFTRGVRVKELTSDLNL